MFFMRANPLRGQVGLLWALMRLLTGGECATTPDSLQIIVLNMLSQISNFVGVPVRKFSQNTAQLCLKTLLKVVFVN